MTRNAKAMTAGTHSSNRATAGKTTGNAVAVPAKRSAKVNKPEVVLEKDPARALVYNVYGRSRSQPLSRQQIYRSFLADERSVSAKPASPGSLRICAEGDSWINILSGISGWPKTFFDVIQERYPNTTSVAFPGDTLQDMLLDMDYEQPIKSGVFTVFIFSGGGNDVLGGGALSGLLRRREDVGNSSNPKAYLNTALLDMTIGVLKSGYLKIARDVEVWSSRTTILVHGYDYPVPRRGGVWIGTPFRNRGYDLAADRDVIAGILKYLVDRFYSMLAQVARERGNVTVVDLRNICRGRWHDELHAREAASRDFAAEFIKEFPVLTA